MNNCEQDYLIVRSPQGDSRAFGEIVRRFQNRSVAYARSILHDREAAHDVAQEVFLQARRDITDLRQPAVFVSWLRRIVFKHCDRLRRQKRVVSSPLELPGMLAGGQEPASVAEATVDARSIRQ